MLFLTLAILGIWIVWSNCALEESVYRIADSQIPRGFDGFRIIQLSDLHQAEFGEGNSRLIEQIADAKPDMIAITGDMIDSRHTNIAAALELAEALVGICPVYYVNGNHEARISEYETLKEGLEAAGVSLLENRKVTIKHSDDQITLMGIMDPAFCVDYLAGDAAAVKSAIGKLQYERDGYTVLLTHRPELFDVYADAGLDLVLAGHTHGGQFRLPFVGGLVAPNQGFFPQYDAGVYEKENTTMVISRGLGASVIPIRFCNRPEIVLIVLNSDL